MRTILIAIAMLLFIGCSQQKSGDSLATPEVAHAINTYFNGDVAEAKAAIWVIIRSGERKNHSGGIDDSHVRRDVYGLALAYTRLAMIAESEGQKEASDSFYSFALRYFSELADLSKDHRIKINRKSAVWAVDSLEHDRPPHWRKILNRPVSLFYPRFQANADGDIVEILKEPNEQLPQPTRAASPRG